jgi:hypothetical protein
MAPNVDLKDYLKAKIGLVENNYELTEEVEYFEELQVDKNSVIYLKLKP